MKGPPRQSVLRLVRPIVRRLQPYVPGEQPKLRGLIKLNTNENPYPPAPEVLAAVRAGADERLRLYPDPTSQALRQKLARFHRVGPENILVGNGSDELLALAVRAFVEPAPNKGRLEVRPPRKGGVGLAAASPALSKSTVQFFEPSYSLYPVLAGMHGARVQGFALEEDFGLPAVAKLRRRGWDFRAALTFITTPNAPSGRGYARAELEPFCAAQRGVVVLDEAYADFGGESALAWSGAWPQVLIARTFSKSFSLCFQRVGYLIGQPELISSMDKIRDSYNVNGLGQLAAEAALDALPYYRRCWASIAESRQRLAHGLSECGFEVWPSRTNFVLTKPPRFSARAWLEKLRREKILVRWFDSERTRGYLRITVGSEAEAAALLGAVKKILAL